MQPDLPDDDVQEDDCRDHSAFDVIIDSKGQCHGDK